MRKSVKKKEKIFFAGLSIFLALFLSFVHMVAFDTLSGSLVGDMNRLYFLVHLHPWKKQYFIEQHKPRYFKVSLSSIEELVNLFYMANVSLGTFLLNSILLKVSDLSCPKCEICSF